MWFLGKCGVPLFYFFILVTNAGLWIAIVHLLTSLNQEDNHENFKKLVGAGILGLISLSLLLIIGCFATKIKLALAIVEAAAEFTASTQRIVFILLLFGSAYFLTILMWFIAFAGVYSSEGFKTIEKNS